MYIDTAIAPSKALWVIKAMFLGCVAVLVWWVDLPVWQMAVILAVAVFCVWQDWASDVPVYDMSVKDPNELWYLGVFFDDREIWQAYLNSAYVVDVGFGRAVRLSFYVVEPHRQPLVTWVFGGSVPMTTFCKLSAVANFGRHN